MELKHSFMVPVPVAEAWDLLLDLERVVPALPGASLTSRDGDVFTGRVKVKVGSIQMAYQGDGKFTQRDEVAHRIVIEAAGRDTRGAGTAKATITCALSAEGEQTRAEVATELALTGRPAQFGRGLLNDVGAKILDQFAANLSTALQASPVADAATESLASDTGETTESLEAGIRGSAMPDAEPLDLMSVAGAAVAKRAAGAVVATAVAFLLVRRLRRRAFRGA